MAVTARIVVTAGEPAGVGPELCAQLAHQDHAAELVFAADADLLLRAASDAGQPLTVQPFDPAQPPKPSAAGCALVHHVPVTAPVTWGKLDVNNARQVLACLDYAIQGCTEGIFAAMVTAPLHKGIINDAGIPFTGHTEYLAEHTRAEHVVMMLVADKLRVALTTTHLPVSAVSNAITAELLKRTLQTLHADLRDKWGFAQPRIVVCGLNPHAGEGGHLGTEDRDIIEPVLHDLRAGGMNLVGPLPADTAFTPRHLKRTDAVLAMYHDQGLPVLKFAGFGQAVNVTLGLPIIRTSVDHGTALDIAGRGAAHGGSMQAALAMAMELAATAGKGAS